MSRIADGLIYLSPVAMFERILGWSTRRLGVLELTEPLIVQDGTAWLRIAPGESPRWYPTLEAAL